MTEQEKTFVKIISTGGTVETTEGTGETTAGKGCLPVPGILFCTLMLNFDNLAG